MAKELPDKLTPIDKHDLMQAFWDAWVKYFGAEPPSKDSIYLLTAQVWLETGLTKCHNYNLGNVKSREGDQYNYQYFACNEVLPLWLAKTHVRKTPQTARITRVQHDKKAVVWFYPKNPGCRFRAFETLQEGVSDHLSLLVKRFSKAWSAIRQGNPQTFAHFLKEQHYYTADESRYALGLHRTFSALKKIGFEPPEKQGLSDEEKAAIALVQTTTQKLVDSLDLSDDAPFDY